LQVLGEEKDGIGGVVDLTHFKANIINYVLPENFLFDVYIIGDFDNNLNIFKVV